MQQDNSIAFDFDSETDLRVMLLFRKVFLDNKQGQEALYIILNELKFFVERVESDEARILSNWGRALLRQIGIWRDIQAPGIINALAKLPNPKKVEEDEIYE